MSATIKKFRLIADTILSDISTGRIRIGDRVQSERQLAELFGVSLGTVQHALDELTRRGVLVREHGRGTFVSGTGSSVDARYVRFRDADGKELPVYWRILGHCKVKTTTQLALIFGTNIPLVRIDRSIDVDRKFLLISQFFLSEANFIALTRGGALKPNVNLREFLSERLMLPTLRLEQLIGFERMPADVARILKCARKQLCFAMELHGYTEQGRPLYLHRIIGEPFENASLLVDVNM